MDRNCEFPQGLKSNAPSPRNGTAEAVPLQVQIYQHELCPKALPSCAGTAEVVLHPVH